ncbi:MAG: hypothetical protein RIB45_10960 [Marivibrio sp.]|uniref:hypothetical protein n=1 Tax=Marivibrio sp. TaxID=2039719 RepID=UPI0032F04044
MAATVSNFELIYKRPNSPTPGGPTPDSVLQGYFLSITNLEDRSYIYNLRFVIPPSSLPGRDLADPGSANPFNTVVTILRPTGAGPTNTLLNTNDGKVFTLPGPGFSLTAHETALVAVTPQTFLPPLGGDAVAVDPFAAPLEARG